MKKQLAISLAVAAALALGTVAASAQTIGVADIPFAFSVGQQALPAGTYLVDPISNTTALMMRGEGKSVLFQAPPVISSLHAMEKGKLVFHCYTGRCFLAQIWRAGDKTARSIGKSPLERELAGLQEQKQVVVAMNR